MEDIMEHFENHVGSTGVSSFAATAISDATAASMIVMLRLMHWLQLGGSQNMEYPTKFKITLQEDR